MAAKGYWGAWREVSQLVTDAVAKAHKDNPQYKVVVAGHSLGGAVATIASALLRDSGHIVDLVCFFFLLLNRSSMNAHPSV
jgi:hypothetical protein